MKDAKPFINPYLAGFLLGLLLIVSFVLTGNGLGASGGLNRLVVAIEDVIAPSHIDRTPYLLTMAGGSLNPLDHWLVAVVAGAILGGFFSGWISNRLGFETIRGPKVSRTERWIWSILGGILMGYGARLARGCTSGQALSGGAVLSAGSWAFMFAVFGGAYGLAYLMRNKWN